MKELDLLLGGGLDRGTSNLLLGPAGTGKSTVATQYVHAALQRGERVAMFNFDESAGTLRARALGIGISLDPYLEQGLLTMRQIESGASCARESSPT